MPTLQDFGLQEFETSQNAVYMFKGGESYGLQRLEEFLKDGMETYKKERNGFVGEKYSSKLSPWLANGCLSIKKVYHIVKEWDKEEDSRNADHFVKHLFVRDFWKYWALHYGNKIFHKYGSIKQHPKEPWDSEPDFSKIDSWKNGQTGIPIVDAIMRDLKVTGYIGNRGRQIAASYLT